MVTVLVTLLGVAGRGCGAGIKDLQKNGPIRGSTDQKVPGSNPGGCATQPQGHRSIFLRSRKRELGHHYARCSGGAGYRCGMETFSRLGPVHGWMGVHT